MGKTHAGNLKLLGGRLCLDFVNTADRHASGQPEESRLSYEEFRLSYEEFLLSYDDLVAWGQHVDLLTEAEGKRLRTLAQARPGLAQQVLTDALNVREALFRIFPRAAEGQAPAAEDLALLNHLLANAPARSQVAWHGSRFEWVWNGPQEALERMLWPVAWSAADLLASDDLSRVRLCPGTGCGWLFLDASRNQSRRWCSMESCGNRAKAQRHYQRTRQS